MTSDNVRYLEKDFGGELSAIALRTALLVSILAALLWGCSKRATSPPNPPTPPGEPFWLHNGDASWSQEGRYVVYDHEARDTLELMRYGAASIWAYDTQSAHFGFLVGPGVAPKWNPEGTILAFNWANSIFFYYSQTRTVRQVTGSGHISTFDWTPDGGRLIFGGTYRGQSGCLIIDTLGNVIRDALPAGWRVPSDACWFSDTILVAASSDSLSRGAVILIDTLANLLDYVVIAEDNWFGAGTYPSWSPDRSRFLLNVSYEVDNHSYSDFRMYTIDGVLERILADSAGTGEWSPDGSKIVFQKYTWMGDNPFPGDPDYGRVTVWICNPDGSDMQELLGWPQPPPDTTMFDGGYNWVTDTYDP